MSVRGPIIILEDDEDDQEFYATILKQLKIGNEVMYFTDAEVAFHFLELTPLKPFIIISDINLPGISGIEFKRKIQASSVIRNKSIPFIFLTTSSDRNSVAHAYEMMVQGYFVKPNSVGELTALIAHIIAYWTFCRHPDSSQ